MLATTITGHKEKRCQVVAASKICIKSLAEIAVYKNIGLGSESGAHYVQQAVIQGKHYYGDEMMATHIFT